MSSRVTYGSESCSRGKYRVAGSSHAMLPASTSIATAAAVIGLVDDPIAKIVCGSTLSGLPTSRTP